MALLWMLSSEGDNNDEAIRGKVALVTGAGSGISVPQPALLLAERGAAIAVAGRRTNKLDEVVAQITAAGGTSIALQTDVSDPAQVQRAVQATVERFGALHFLVNNAGITGYFEAADRDHHRKGSGSRCSTST